jgi:hypothetical protein
MAPAPSACPGCGVELPPNRWTLHLGCLASTECWELYGEVQAATIDDGDLRPYHQRAVDTYLAQHAGGPSSDLGVAFALIGLFLAIERGRSGIEIRREHERLARTRRTWPHLEPPTARGGVTVFDVAIAGSVEERTEAIERWSRSVWAAWSSHHATVEALVPPREVPRDGGRPAATAGPGPAHPRDERVEEG